MTKDSATMQQKAVGAISLAYGTIAVAAPTTLLNVFAFSSNV